MTQSHFVFRSMVYAVHCAESNPCRKIQSIFANQNDIFCGQKSQRETEWRGEGGDGEIDRPQLLQTYSHNNTQGKWQIEIYTHVTDTQDTHT